MIPIYIVSYNNPSRSERMVKRFTSLHLDHLITFTPEVHATDSRLVSFESNRRTASIMLQHLDSLRLFLATPHDHAIICEDDIHISSTFAEKLPSILHDFKEMKLDIMMLGYILTFHIDMNSGFHQGYFPYVNDKNNQSDISSHTYHSFPDDIWGSQMYLVSRSYARHLLDTYDCVDENMEMLTSLTYNPDWIITKPKKHKRALIYPMVALEEKNDGGQNYNYEKQYHAHYNTTFL